MSSPESTATAYDWGIGDRIPAAPDNITTVLPNATTVTTAVFNFGKVQAGVELEIFTVNELTVANGATLTAELEWDTASDGSFADSKTIFALAPVGSAQVIAADTSIERLIPESDVELYCRIKYTASGNLAAFSVISKLFPIV